MVSSRYKICAQHGGERELYTCGMGSGECTCVHIETRNPQKTYISIENLSSERCFIERVDLYPHLEIR